MSLFIFMAVSVWLSPEELTETEAPRQDEDGNELETDMTGRLVFWTFYGIVQIYFALLIFSSARKRHIRYLEIPLCPCCCKKLVCSSNFSCCEDDAIMDVMVQVQ